MSVDDRGHRAGSAVRRASARVETPDPAVVVRRGTRRRRTRAAALAAVTLLAAGAVAVPVLAHDDDRVTVTAPARDDARRTQVDDRYVPPTTTADGVTTMPVTLPDGRPFTVRYAARLDLAQRGFRSTVAARLQLGGPQYDTQARTLQVLHTTTAERYRGLSPVATYPDAEGRPVPYYVDPNAPERSGLAVQIGDWLVVVPDLDDPANHPDDHLTPDQLALWAQNVGGWVDGDGFLVIASTGRALTLDQSAKVAFVLGPTSSHSGSVTVGERWMCEGPGTDTTTPRRFPQTPPGANQGAAWCDRATGLHVTVIGPPRFVDRAVDSLRLAPFSTAKRATRVVTAARSVRAGALLRGVVLVVNNTGAPLTYTGCGGLFGISLTKPGVPPISAWPSCAQRIIVPEGESSYPAGVSASEFTCASVDGCPLAPGRYEAAFVQDGADFPPAAPIPVRVVAPPG
jgi:hypothetical protein